MKQKNNNNNYDSLEQEIGAMGGENQPQDDGLGRLSKPEMYGQKSNLSDEDQDSMKAFLARSQKKEEQIEMSVSEGWIPFDRSELGKRSEFYPESWEFFIKAATVQSIKNWSSIDEERPDQVNRVFDEIVKACVKIDTHSEEGAGWAQINSWDRFFFILKVREATFTKGESKVTFENPCSECDTDITYTLDSKSLFYDFPDDDLIEKYWTGSCWKIDPSEYDVDHDPIVLYTPKLGKDEAIIDWATARIQQKQKVDETFIKFLVWMLNKPSRDPQMLDRQIQRLYSEYKSWDADMFSFMDDVVNNITINPSEKLRTICPHCGRESVSDVQFPNGIKSLFQVKRTGKKFGSK